MFLICDFLFNTCMLGMNAYDHDHDCFSEAASTMTLTWTGVYIYRVIIGNKFLLNCRQTRTTTTDRRRTTNAMSWHISQSGLWSNKIVYKDEIKPNRILFVSDYRPTLFKACDPSTFYSNLYKKCLEQRPTDPI